MTPNEFVKKFYPFANEAEVTTGISAVAILAQAALESAWGSVAPGNMFFGVKSSNPKEKRQLLTTTEYSTRPDLKFPEVISVTKVGSRYKYKVKDWFRAYDSPAESFIHHGKFLLANPRYSAALKVKHDPVLFVQGLAKAGYATDPNYGATLTKIVEMIRKQMTVK